MVETAGNDANTAGGGEMLARLLRGEWRDPDTGSLVDAPAVAVSIEPSLAGREAQLVAALALGDRIAVVSDDSTHAVLGARVACALSQIALVETVTIGRNPHADSETVERLQAATRNADALVAVGSGTINDLCKFVAAKDGKRYAVFATAPSMNGYTSTNASITVDGHKATLPATLACGVFVDLEVLCGAPRRMIRAGIGDSLCRSTAQADWLLSHCLFATPYRSAPFALLAADEDTLLDASAELVAGDIDAMAALARTLVLSGLGMTLCGGSHPASQGEHLISHYIDMCAPAARGDFLHGEQVGVATLTMSRLQQAMLDRGPPRLRRAAIDRAALSRQLGEAMAAACWDEFSVKQAAASAAAVVAAAQIDRHWDAWRARIAASMVAHERLDEALARAGAPRGAAELGLSHGFYAEAVANARYLRNRYTFLDLVAAADGLDAWFAA